MHGNRFRTHQPCTRSVLQNPPKLAVFHHLISFHDAALHLLPSCSPCWTPALRKATTADAVYAMPPDVETGGGKGRAAAPSDAPLGPDTDTQPAAGTGGAPLRRRLSNTGCAAGRCRARRFSLWGCSMQCQLGSPRPPTHVPASTAHACRIRLCLLGLSVRAHLHSHPQSQKIHAYGVTPSSLVHSADGLVSLTLYIAC